VKRSAFMEYVSITAVRKLGIAFEVLLSFTSNVVSAYKFTKDSSLGPTMLFLFNMMVPNDVTFFNAWDMVPNKPNFPWVELQIEL
jgi:hypothetical protein